MLTVIILAAGEGKRFRSFKPKVLHTIAGKPMLDFSIEKALELRADRILIVAGFQCKQIEGHIEELKRLFTLGNVTIVTQKERKGTGNAILPCLDYLPELGETLVLYGDTPLVDVQDLRMLISSKSVLSILTATVENPEGYGRIIRHPEHSDLVKIIEESDASAEQKKIKEINVGALFGINDHLKSWVRELDDNNSQKEYYLSDVVKIAKNKGYRVKAVKMTKGIPIGVNTRKDLVNLEKVYNGFTNEKLMEEGLGIVDPDRFNLRGELSFGMDVQVDINVVISGNCRLGDNVKVGPNVLIDGNCRIGDNVKIGANCVVVDSLIEDSSEIFAFSHLQGAHVGRGCLIGPYSRLRPMSQLNSNVKVGNFVEIKKTIIQAGSKIPHLSYIGDSMLGERVNIGAGTITCNYDGRKKSKTIIEDDCFIGSGVQLVAPLRIATGSLVGAGSVITEDVEKHSLAIARSKQVIKERKVE